MFKSGIMSTAKKKHDASKKALMEALDHHSKLLPLHDDVQKAGRLFDRACHAMPNGGERRYVEIVKCKGAPVTEAEYRQTLVVQEALDDLENAVEKKLKYDWKGVMKTANEAMLKVNALEAFIKDYATEKNRMKNGNREVYDTWKAMKKKELEKL